ncbi:MAG: hypothetical protein WCD89_17145 [Anaerocolumna sp.]
MEEIKEQVSVSSGSSAISEQTGEQESSLLAGLGIGTTIDTLV